MILMLVFIDISFGSQIITWYHWNIFQQLIRTMERNPKKTKYKG